MKALATHALEALSWWREARPNGNEPHTHEKSQFWLERGPGGLLRIVTGCEKCAKNPLPESP